MRITCSLFAAYALWEVLVGSVAAEQITSTCRITAVEAGSRTVTLARMIASGEKTGRARAADDAKITIDGKSAPLDSLLPPVSATVIYDTELRALVSIQVAGDSPDDKSEPPRATAPFGAAKAKEHQEAWARHLGVPVETTNSIGMKLVLIPPGEFQMGAPSDEVAWVSQQIEADTNDSNQQKFWIEAARSETPQHRAATERPYFIGQCEVTVAEFRRFILSTGYQTDAEKAERGGWGFDADSGKRVGGKEYNWRNTGFDQPDGHPVVNVSWNDAQAFCRWLGTAEKRGYRLPSEAEWEYACRAGTTTRWNSGDAIDALQSAANLRDAAYAAVRKYGSTASETPTIPWNDNHAFTSPVRSFRPNPFGLYDMHGNVWEWCADRYAAEPHNRQTVGDNAPRTSDDLRSVRGGSFARSPWGARSATRGGDAPEAAKFGNGFRVARDAYPAR